MFRLARELHMPVSQVARTVSPAEFAEWIALWRLEAREAEERDMARRAQQGVEQRLARARRR